MSTATQSNSKKARPGNLPQQAEANDNEPSRHQLIALAAYKRAEKRGFAPGFELDDWLEAERTVEAHTETPSGNLAA